MYVCTYMYFSVFLLTGIRTCDSPSTGRGWLSLTSIQIRQVRNGILITTVAVHFFQSEKILVFIDF